MARRPHSVRTASRVRASLLAKLGAVLCLLLLAAPSVLQAVHYSLVAHEYCEAHGALEHRADGDVHGHELLSHDADSFANAQGPQLSELDDEEHDDCDIALVGLAADVARPFSPAGEVVSFSSTLEPAPSIAPPLSSPLAYAPKTSPPTT